MERGGRRLARLGAAPAALILGAGMARRHDGAVPLLALLAGAILMAALLFGQGTLGLRQPYGENAALTELAPRYLPDRAGVLLGAVLAAAMIGWNGFNVGLGGASLAKVTGLPGPAGALLLAGAVLAASFLPGRWNNRIAVLTTVAALALVAVCVLLLRPDSAPVTADPGGWATLADIAAIGGYVAVFALRAPDFSRGLATRRDLAICVALLVGPAILVTAAGAGVWLRTGSADVVAVLASAPGVAVYGNIFVTVGVFAPALTTTFSGALALRAVAAAAGHRRDRDRRDPRRHAGRGALRPGAAHLADRTGRHPATADHPDGRRGLAATAGPPGTARSGLDLAARRAGRDRADRRRLAGRAGGRPRDRGGRHRLAGPPAAAIRPTGVAGPTGPVTANAVSRPRSGRARPRRRPR
ncbi:hypothetical protein ACFQZ4_49600 [Catellatospora coxensis]